MAKIIRTPSQCWIERVVDSDTLVIWLEVSPDIRHRCRLRLKGVEGGELGTVEGEAGRFELLNVIGKHTSLLTYLESGEREFDRYGRRVGHIRYEDGTLLVDKLLAAGHHWRRGRSGKELTQLV